MRFTFSCSVFNMYMHILANVASFLAYGKPIISGVSWQERAPPCVDDFLYICDDAYKRSQLIAMEMCILQALNFDINIPVPYRFLRRFAKVRMNTHTLTGETGRAQLCDTHHWVNVTRVLVKVRETMHRAAWCSKGAAFDWPKTLFIKICFSQKNDCTWNLCIMLKGTWWI